MKHILIAFLLITIALLIAVSIYCYLIKYKGKQKYLLPFYVTNNELKEALYQLYIIKMESNYEFKKIDIKNRTCHYFDDIMRVEDIDFDYILLDERSYKNILTHDISCKTFMGAKPLRIRFDKVDRIIKIYNGTR